MTGAVEVLTRLPVVAAIDRLTREVADALLAPDPPSASELEAYLAGIRSDLSEAVIEAIGDVLVLASDFEDRA